VLIDKKSAPSALYHLISSLRSLIAKEQIATKTCCDHCLQCPVRNKQLLLRRRNSHPKNVNQVSSCAFYSESLRTRGFRLKRTYSPVKNI